MKKSKMRKKLIQVYWFFIRKKENLLQIKFNPFHNAKVKLENSVGISMGTRSFHKTYRHLAWALENSKMKTKKKTIRKNNRFFQVKTFPTSPETRMEFSTKSREHENNTNLFPPKIHGHILRLVHAWNKRSGRHRFRLHIRFSFDALPLLLQQKQTKKNRVK